ncbi:Uma2 family endonuclease [Maioricimonas sp. JC845]|uniref:Uma2 family endonuclease n=1 Tax=Maioricimonas sp. JC845 TaxID=3232138 RepID=UPI003459E4EB
MIRTLTAEQFIEQRFDMPDSGQWAELVEGVPVFLEPPDLDHGNAILNLSKAVAAYVQQGVPGYACFDLGLLMGRAPDTIRFPAMCWFATGERFEESDKDITETVPTLVVDMASTPDRRRHVAGRIRHFLEWGVSTVWVIDSGEETVEVFESLDAPRRFSSDEQLPGEPILEGFRMPVCDLFVQPAWWA